MNDIQKARELLFENTPVTKIFETYILPDAIDFVCCCSGDSVIYRVYNDGRIVER